jgi:hypothetical protein
LTKHNLYQWIFKKVTMKMIYTAYIRLRVITIQDRKNNKYFRYFHIFFFIRERMHCISLSFSLPLLSYCSQMLNK